MKLTPTTYQATANGYGYIFNLNKQGWTVLRHKEGDSFIPPLVHSMTVDGWQHCLKMKSTTQHYATVEDAVAHITEAQNDITNI